MEIKQVPAHINNYGVGRAGKKVELVVLHWIVGTLESADATFKKPDRKASAHYGIGDEEIHQYVKESDTAWHASNLGVNQRSIGIEHEGGWEYPKDSGKRVKPSAKTHETSAKLVADIAKRYNIPLDRQHIIKHSEVSGASTACSGTLDIDLIISMAKEINNPSEVNNWENILKKKLVDDAWKMLTEFEKLRKVGLIARDDSIQTQTQKWLLYSENVNKRIKELEESIDSEKQASFAEGVKKGRESEFDRITKQLEIEVPEPKEEFDFTNWKTTEMGSSKSNLIQELINWLLMRK